MNYNAKIDQIIDECSNLSYDQLRYRAFRSFNIVFDYCKDFFTLPHELREYLRCFMIYFAILDGDLDEDEFGIIQYIDEVIDFDEARDIAYAISRSSIYDDYCSLFNRLPDYEAIALIDLCVSIMFSDGGLTRGEYDFIKGHSWN